jgi:hypothetical protein
VCAGGEIIEVISTSIGGGAGGTVDLTDVELTCSETLEDGKVYYYSGAGAATLTIPSDIDYFEIRNTGGGAMTFDPDAAQTIYWDSGVAFNQGQSVVTAGLIGGAVGVPALR